jgi:hypothetical protein
LQNKCFAIDRFHRQLPLGGKNDIVHRIRNALNRDLFGSMPNGAKFHGFGFQRRSILLNPFLCHKLAFVSTILRMPRDRHPTRLVIRTRKTGIGQLPELWLLNYLRVGISRIEEVRYAQAWSLQNTIGLSMKQPEADYVARNTVTVFQRLHSRREK